MQVTLYQRRPQGADFSIERLFANLHAAMPKGIDTRPALCRFPSRGLWRRMYNLVEAVFRQGDVNHITGDVHFLALLLRRRRTLLTIHDLVSVHRLSGLRRSVFVLLWYRLPIKKSALVTVISESTKKQLLRHIAVDPARIRVVHNCVSAAFRRAPKQFNFAKPVVLQVGTGPNKNLERLAESLHGVPCHLRVIGRLNDPQTAALRHYKINYSSVSDITDEQVVDEYRNCDMLVFASTYEGFGLPIVEAQATGRPVVTSNILSMPEVAGDGACFVDPFDPNSIREGVLKVMRSPAYAEDLVRRGFANVERFRPERIAAQYAEIYRELAAATSAADYSGQSHGTDDQGQ